MNILVIGDVVGNPGRTILRKALPLVYRKHEIEYCIANKLARFDPGAQGEHKIQRGFRPITTWSNHWIADPKLSAAVGDFTRREALHNEQYRHAAASMLPFK